MTSLIRSLAPFGLSIALLFGAAGARAQVSEADEVRLVAISLHNSGDDDVELTFNAPVCARGQAHTAFVTRQGTTNFDAVVSMLMTALLANFKIKIDTEDASCRLVHVWFKRSGA